MSTPADLSDADVRLSTDSIPSRYDVDMRIDLIEENFAGTVAIAIDVHKATSSFTMNSVELKLSNAYVVDGGGNRLDAVITEDAKLERATFALAGLVEPGAYTLHCDFAAPLNLQMQGLYKSQATMADGTPYVIASSQMQATDCRRVFPCWDEPAFKAVFALSLTVAADQVVLANTEEVTREPLGNGLVRVTFAPTIALSTYLVAMAVGPFDMTETVSVGGVDLRVVTPPGKAHLASTALEFGAYALEFFSNWFGHPYPSNKLDLLAVPDFAAGAMENLGLSIYRETTLLCDAETASTVDAQTVAIVVGHEISHMWFGDLVTMQWWEGIWLNEAFASYCEVLVTDSWNPAWKLWVAECLSKAAALQVDALNSTRPIEFPVRLPSDADAMFDVITYQKGGAVLRMLEQYLGADRYRDGIRAYIAKHAYSNTVTRDLWDAIETSSGEPVRALMDSWIYQAGHPLISASLSGSSLSLKQTRFLYLPEEQSAADASKKPIWQVPLVLRGSADGKPFEHRTLLTTESTIIELPDNVDYVVVNGNGSGVFRTAVSNELLEAQLANYSQLADEERFHLANDTWAAVLANAAPISQVIRLAEFLAVERDPSVWAALAAPFDLMLRAEGVDVSALRAFLHRAIDPTFKELGLAAKPLEPEVISTLRPIVIKAHGEWSHDQGVIDWAKETRAAFLADRNSVDGDLVLAATLLDAEAQSPSSYKQSIELLSNPLTPQDVERELAALARYDDPDVVDNTLDLFFSDVVRPQDMPRGLVALLAHRTNSTKAWDVTTERWTDLQAKLPPMMIARVYGTIFMLPPSRADVAHKFLEEHTFPEGAMMLRQGLERLRVHTRLRTTQGAAINAAI